MDIAAAAAADVAVTTAATVAIVTSAKKRARLQSQEACKKLLVRAGAAP